MPDRGLPILRLELRTSDLPIPDNPVDREPHRAGRAVADTREGCRLRVVAGQGQGAQVDSPVSAVRQVQLPEGKEWPPGLQPGIPQLGVDLLVSSYHALLASGVYSMSI